MEGSAGDSDRPRNADPCSAGFVTCWKGRWSDSVVLVKNVQGGQLTPQRGGSGTQVYVVAWFLTKTLKALGGKSRSFQQILLRYLDAYIGKKKTPGLPPIINKSQEDNQFEMDRIHKSKN